MLKIGIIGSGFGLYGLAPAFSSIENCRVVAICGKKSERLISYCRSIGLKNIYTDWQEMLDNEELDAIAIAVPPSVQYAIAKKAIGMRLNIFAEKPLALNYKQANELFVLAKKKKITHGIDFIFPEIDQWKKTKNLLDNKTFGKLEHVSVNWDFESYDIKNKISSWKTNTKEGGGALSFYFSHALYYLEYFAGEILDIKSVFSYSKKSTNGGETGVDLILKFKTGTNGYAHISCDSKGINRHRLLFQCEKGTIILESNKGVTDNFTINTYNQNGKENVFISENKISKEDEDERVKIVRKLAERFINACLFHTQMTPSFRDGLRVQELIEKIKVNQI